MDARLLSALRNEIGPDEELVWHGRPDVLQYTRAPFLCATFVVAVLAVSHLSFELFAAKPAKSGDIASVHYVIAYAAIISAMACFPLWSYFKARSILYFLTSKRAVMIFSFPSPQVWSVPATEFSPIEWEIKGNGVGNVYFTTKQSNDGDRGKHFVKDGFLSIPDVEKVVCTIQGLTSSTKSKS